MIFDVHNMVPGDVIARDVDEEVAVFDRDVPMLVLSCQFNQDDTECHVMGLHMIKSAMPHLQKVTIDRSNIREYRTVVKV